MPDSPVAPRPFRIGLTVGAPILALVLMLPVVARAATPRVHAIVGARIVTAPGQVIEHGTIVIRDGLIVAVGAGVPVPADARVWPGDSLTVYPGLLDACVVMSAPTPAAGGATARTPDQRRPPSPAESRGAAHALASVTPEVSIAGKLPLPKDQIESLRGAGFAAAHVIPRTGIVRGRSAVVGLEDAAPNSAVVTEDAAQVMALEPVRSAYPASLMGVVAVLRQTFLDAKWYRDARAAYARAPQNAERPETNVAYEALQPVIGGSQPVWMVADDMLEVLRASAIAKEAGVRAVVVGGGDEYKRAKDIVATGTPLVVPVAFPEAPDVSDADDALEVSTEELRHWDRAASNPSWLAKAGATFAVTTTGMKDLKQFRANMTRAIQRGWPIEQALASVTTVPAKLLGLDQRLGTIAPGRIANLTVTRGELFSERGVVRDVWVDGTRYEVNKDSTTVAGRWLLGADTLVVRTDPDTMAGLVANRDTVRARMVRVDGPRVRFTLEKPGAAPATYELKAANDALAGSAEGAPVGARRLVEPQRPKREAFPDRVLETAWVPGDPEAFRAPQPEQPPVVLVRHATIWTSGPQGTLDDADLLVKAGKIAAVGRGLAAPARAVVIDATGRHVSAGVIDEHSHSAILGDVNECTNSVTCEVRIQDVINSESRQIYQQLAGGTTEMHLLHGSCNAIGGQCAVIKNRWGAAPEDLLFRAAPPTVKFALGENPKQSNWGAEATGRYPQSRAGVEQVIRDAFLRARDYEARQAEWQKFHRGLPPRRDLQLDALAEIVDGRRYIHCHSYRQDEILMLMRLAESFNFRVNTFTHILEGYKVADEMAAHGASAMGFSDWWAYKYEVIDAIPWNGYLLWDRGVNAGFNSDDSELARRLNTEAAKAVKYGGVPPAEALRFVTLNPAKSLKIDDKVGSLEPGKDADFVIWSGSPLSPYAAAEQTWIEGRKYFDRAADLAARATLAQERATLIAKAKAARKERPGGQAVAGRWPPRYLEDTAMDGNDCQGDQRMPFLGEAERRALRAGEEQR